MVPLDVVDRVLGEDARRAARTGSPKRRAGRGRAPAGGAGHRADQCRAEDPVRVGPAQVGVGVDHLRLEPQAELHAAPRTASVSGCRPCGHTPSSTYQSPSPAVSSRRCRNQPSSSTNRSTPALRRARRAAAAGRAVVEVDRLPHVERHRPGPPVGAGAAAGRGATRGSGAETPSSPRPLQDPYTIGRASRTRPGRARPRRAAAARRRGEDGDSPPEGARPTQPPLPLQATCIPRRPRRSGSRSPEWPPAGRWGRRDRCGRPRASRSQLPIAERVPLRAALAAPAAGQVQQLAAHRGQRERDGQTVDVVRSSSPSLRERVPGPEQARRRELELGEQAEPGLHGGRADRESTDRTVGSSTDAGRGRRQGPSRRRRDEVRTAPAGPSQPRRVLGQQREPDRDVRALPWRRARRPRHGRAAAARPGRRGRRPSAARPRQSGAGDIERATLTRPRRR